MALSLDQFTKQLTGSGLMSADDLTAYVDSLSEQPADAETLAKNLVADKKLTSFQATAIWKGRTQQLVLGEYAILDKIGAGGMGEVYKARHQRMQRIVALKVLPESMTKDEQTIKRFEREVVAAAKLTHPNIVTAYDAREDNGITYLVMEYVEGRDLSAIVKKQGPATVEQSINCILQAARGLEYAHKNGVIHRDIKPANLLFDKEGTVKILDMGLARIDASGIGQDDEAQAELTSTGTIMGTVDYMSPEQAADTKEADARADIYSLGCSLWYLLTGKPVYAGTTVIKKIFAHKDHPIPSLKETLAPGEHTGGTTLTALDAVFQKMVAKELADRYQTMTEVIADLEAIQAGSVPVATTSSPGIQPVAAGRNVDSGMASFLNNLDSEESATDHTVVAPVEQQAGHTSDTFADSQEQFTKQRAAATQQLSSVGGGKSLTGHRKFIIGGSVAAVVLVGALIWGFSGGEGDKPNTKSVAGKQSKKKSSSRKSATDKGTAPPPAVAPFDEAQARAHQKAWADYLGLPVEKEIALPGGEKMALMLIPPGEFLMGSTEDERLTSRDEIIAANLGWGHDRIESEGPPRRVRITHAFYLGKYEVTQFQWLAVMDNNPSQFSNDPFHPVERVSWDNVQTFLGKLNGDSSGDQHHFVLPTEAQWEYSCCAGTTTRWHFGDDKNLLRQYAWYIANSMKTTHPVGQLKPNNFGIYDMHGNVWEWCVDWYSPMYYSSAPTDDLGGPATGSLRVDRGGSFKEPPVYCRSSMRNNCDPQIQYYELLGFRVAMMIDTTNLKGTSTPPTDPDRAAAEWVLGIGGRRIVTDAGTFTKVGQLPQQRFRISQIVLTGNLQVTDDNLENLKGVTNLKKLHLSQTQVGDAGLEHLKRLTNLTHLEFYNTKVSAAGLVHIQGLTNLTDLNLGKTKLSDAGLEHLKGLTKLIILYLGDTKVSDAGLVHIQGLTNLTSLFLLQTNVSDAGLVHLKGLTKLRTLNLIETKVTAAGVANLQKALPDCNLKWDGNIDPDRQAAQWVLSTGGRVKTNLGEFTAADQLPKEPFHITGIWTQENKQLMDRDLENLKGLKEIKRLDIGNSQVTDVGLEHLKELKSLTVLALLYSNVTGTGFMHLKGLTNLDQLILAGSVQVDGVGFEHLTALPKLRVLNCDSTNVTNQSLEHLKGITQLGALNLNRTKVSNEGLEHLKGLTTLTGLVLTKTKVTAAGVADLQKVLPNCKITWDDNTDPDRAVAEWVLANHGWVQVRIQNIGTPQTIKSGETLPDGPFAVVLAQLDQDAKSVTDEDMKKFASLENLTRLNFSNLPITDEGIRYLSESASIVELHLYGTHGTSVTDKALQYFKKMPQIKSLGLANTKMTESAIETLESFPNLEGLTLSHGILTSTSIPKIGRLKNLRLLTITGVPVFTDEDLQHVAKLPHLTRLVFNFSNISDAGLKHLEALQKLETLQLSKTKVTVAGAKALSKKLPNCEIRYGSLANPTIIGPQD